MLIDLAHQLKTRQRQRTSGEPRAADPGLSAAVAFARWNEASEAVSNVIDLSTGVAIEQPSVAHGPTVGSPASRDGQCG